MLFLIVASDSSSKYVIQANIPSSVFVIVIDIIYASVMFTGLLARLLKWSWMTVQEYYPPHRLSFWQERVALTHQVSAFELSRPKSGSCETVT